nr:hypothetical protein [uncultured Dyadobacter sp.]
MTTAKEIAEKYIWKLRGNEFAERFANEIIQYAIKAILQNRTIIKAKKAPPQIIEYLPVEIQKTWPSANSDSPLEIALRYVDHSLGRRAEDDLEKEIVQYAQTAVTEDRLLIKANNVLPHLVIYLPLPLLE